MNKYYLSLVFAFISLVSSAAEQKDFADLEGVQKAVHLDLLVKATREKEERNHFAVCFRFIFEDGDERFLDFPSKEGKYFFASGSNCALKDNNGELTPCAKCHGCLCNLAEENPADHGLSDSEFSFLVCAYGIGMNPVHEFWAKNLERVKKKVENKIYLKKIEIHGFSTRDMCTNCCAHLESFVSEANFKDKQFPFWQTMRAVLGIPSKGELVVEMYVSSIIQFGDHNYSQQNAKLTNAKLFYVFLHNNRTLKKFQKPSNLQEIRTDIENLNKKNAVLEEKIKILDAQIKSINESLSNGSGSGDAKKLLSEQRYVFINARKEIRGDIEIRKLYISNLKQVEKEETNFYRQLDSNKNLHLDSAFKAYALK